MTQHVETQGSDAPAYRIGDCAEDGQYPVTSLTGAEAGHIYRWHRAWYAVPAGQPDSTRTKHPDREAAAAHLCQALTSGIPSVVPAAAEPVTVPYLRGLKPTPSNLTNAARALARLAELAWEPLEGYPGADNRWRMRCFCGWTGTRWWSHLRGRNNDNTPRPENRHEGCIPMTRHAETIARLYTPSPTCTCSPADSAGPHPTTPDAAADLLKSVARARKSADHQELNRLVILLLGPCPAASARAQALRDVAERRKS
ncbi:hypothetical protein AB0393_34705 [Streptomyces cyaneofuscatus]|uniref:hypothetical protein n=1 Tax=Streptomyces cyaneofuscatus TaxID=66883 RepID=UPI00344EC73B